MRNTMRLPSGRPELRSIIAFWISVAQRTASTTLRNSTIAPSPVRLTTRPRCTATVGSIRSLRSALRRARIAQGYCPRQRRQGGYIRRRQPPKSQQVSVFRPSPRSPHPNSLARIKGPVVPLRSIRSVVVDKTHSEPPPNVPFGIDSRRSLIARRRLLRTSQMVRDPSVADHLSSVAPIPLA
jgi:hypothetical protein